MPCEPICYLSWGIDVLWVYLCSICWGLDALRAYALNVEGLMPWEFILYKLGVWCPDWYHMHVDVDVVALSSVGVIVDALSLSSSCQMI